MPVEVMNKYEYIKILQIVIRNEYIKNKRNLAKESLIYENVHGKAACF